MTFRGFWFGKSSRLISARYRKGIASYGKPVKSEKRKARIIAELNAMGVKPRLRRKMAKPKTVQPHYDYARLLRDYPLLFGRYK